MPLTVATACRTSAQRGHALLQHPDLGAGGRHPILRQATLEIGAFVPAQVGNGQRNCDACRHNSDTIARLTDPLSSASQGRHVRTRPADANIVNAAPCRLGAVTGRPGSLPAMFGVHTPVSTVFEVAATGASMTEGCLNAAGEIPSRPWT